MKIFAIRDDGYVPNKDLAYLLYFEKEKDFYIEIPEGADPWETPILLSSFVEQGEYTVNSHWSRIWVQQRIVPRDRQNIGQILLDNNLEAYDEYSLLLLAKGRCAQDDYYILPIEEEQLPEEIRMRLLRRVAYVTPLEDYIVIVGFLDGTVKECNMKPYFEAERKFGILLKNNKYFQHVSVQSGGYGIKWDNNLVVPNNLLYMWH